MMNPNDQRYVGIHDDLYGGMTPIGGIIKDAWVFGLIPETESGAGWTAADMQKVYDQVSAAWAPYGHLVSQLPADLRERHARIHEAAIATAKAQGWEPGRDLDSEMES
ncbi:hypothetical protein [Thiorhodospira sibirica]|uniref:hypothetical protein n=1 Tax=Thiorhodospira sibirica TaxID=154347 RepID=UPI00022C4017|nr:hypothetical protein [Thiorhodospira sibirica]